MPKKILIVDDNIMSRRMLRSTLLSEYDILEAENGREALAILDGHCNGLSAVLLDIIMPEIDGYEVLERIRSNPALTRLPVIMVTGSEDDDAKIKALAIGANDFILKPFNPDIVKHCLYNNIALCETEQKNAYLAGQFQAVLDNVGCGITAITFNDDGSVEYLLINDKYYEILGYTKEEYRKIETFSPIYTDDRQKTIDAAKNVYASGKPMTVEYRAVRFDGSVFWMRASITMTRFAGVEKPVQLSMFTDITAEREAAGELLDNLPDGAALYEYDGEEFKVIHLNKRYWELVNRAPIDSSALSLISSVHPDDVETVKREMTEAIRLNTDRSCDIRIRYGGEGYRPFRVVGRIRPKANGVYYLNAIYTPISDEAMSIQEMLPIVLQAVMDSSSELSFVKDKNLRYICCSRRFATLAGRAGGNELIGKTSSDVFPPELAEQYENADRKVLESGMSLVDFDALFPTEDGIRYLLFSKHPLLDAKGNFLGVYGTGRDITEARQTKSQLELLTDNIPGGIAVYEGTPALDKIRLTYFTDGLSSLFGYTREEYEKLAEVNPLGQVFSSDVTKMYERVKALVYDGVPMDYIYRARVNGGAVKWINVKAVMGEPHGSNLTVNALLFDVTEQNNALEKLRMSEEINRLAIQQSKNVVCQYDIASKILHISPNVESIFEISSVEEDIPDKLLRENKVSPETANAYTSFYESIISGEREGSVLYQRKSTVGWRWVEAHYTTIFSDNGEPVTAVISYSDVTENIEKDAAYKKWQQSIRNREPDSYSLYHCNMSKGSVLSSTEGLLIPDGQLDMLATNFDDRTAQYLEKCVFSDDCERFMSFMKRDAQLLRYAQGRRTDTIEYRERLQNGDTRWLRLTVDLVDSPYSDDVEAYLLFENIDEAKRAELDMIERAETDPLTGLLNRATFSAKVDRLISESKPDTQHALLMLDIDGFKLVNDVFGHGAGDQTLIDIAGLLRKGMRRSDLVGRLGGDEFVVFLPDIPVEAAVARKAEQICEITRKALSMEVQISGSVGIALYPKDGDSFEALYKKADKTLYYVKDTGKNRYAFYSDEIVTEETGCQIDDTRSSVSVMNGRKHRMLIVDDSRIDYDMLENMFRDEFKIEKAMDGASALIKLHHYGSAISIVLLDLMMPGMDGFAVLEKMQQSADTKSIPVIVVSGTDEQETGLEAIRTGAADFVTKPVDTDVLRIRVRAAISKADNERLRAQNSFLELQGNEMNSYKTVLERTGTVVIVHDWVKSTFTYSPFASKYLFGRYDGRSLWRILLSDLVTDSQTVRIMQQFIHDLANDRSIMDGHMAVPLKVATGGKHMFDMNVYKQVNDYGLTDKLIITLKEKEADSR